MPVNGVSKLFATSLTTLARPDGSGVHESQTSEYGWQCLAVRGVCSTAKFGAQPGTVDAAQKSTLPSYVQPQARNVLLPSCKASTGVMSQGRLTMDQAGSCMHASPPVQPASHRHTPHQAAQALIRQLSSAWTACAAPSFACAACRSATVRCLMGPLGPQTDYGLSE